MIQQLRVLHRIRSGLGNWPTSKLAQAVALPLVAGGLSVFTMDLAQAQSTPALPPQVESCGLRGDTRETYSTPRCQAIRAAYLDFRCDHYARLGATQARAAIDSECGFSGALWSNDPAVQTDVCAQASATQLPGIVRARAADLNRCLSLRAAEGQRQDQGGDADTNSGQSESGLVSCASYAATAIADVSSAQERGCQLDNIARFSGNADIQAAFCAQATPAVRAAEAAARSKYVSECAAPTVVAGAGDAAAGEGGLRGERPNPFASAVGDDEDVSSDQFAAAPAVDGDGVDAVEVEQPSRARPRDVASLPDRAPDVIAPADATQETDDFNADTSISEDAADFASGGGWIDGPDEIAETDGDTDERTAEDRVARVEPEPETPRIPGAWGQRSPDVVRPASPNSPTTDDEDVFNPTVTVEPTPTDPSLTDDAFGPPLAPDDPSGDDDGTGQVVVLQPVTPSDPDAGEDNWDAETRPNFDEETLDRQANAAGFGAASAVCRAYAREAITTVGTMQLGSCAVPANARFAATLGPHLTFCRDVGGDPRALNREQRRREARAGACELEATSCETYASRAVVATRRAEQGRCSVRGPRWSLRRDVHLRFCQRVGQERRADEEAARERGLQACASRGDSCGRYVERAVDLVQRARRNNCGFSGERWSPRPADHQAFCLGTPARVLVRENRARFDGLRRCERQRAAATRAGPLEPFARPDPRADRSSQGFDATPRRGDRRARRADCRRYVDEAVRSQRVNVARRCGYRGRPDWSLGRRAHMRFCMRAPLRRVAAASRMRRLALSECASRNGFSAPGWE